MFYVLNLDHHGDYQGVYYKFDTKEGAKSYLEKKSDTIRIGLIGYSTFSSKKLLSNIIFESSAGDVVFNRNSGYDAEHHSVFHTDMNNALIFVSKYKEIICDDIFD